MEALTLAGSSTLQPLPAPHPFAEATNSRVASLASTSTLPPPPASSSSKAPAAPSLPSHASAGCRLLWRGRLLITTNRVGEHDKPLFGIAIIAHLFSVPLLSPKQIAAQPSPFDDPFSSASTNSSSGADMCLGLEMMRGGDLKVLGEVWVSYPAAGVGSSSAKGKGKGREMVEVETPTDVRVYIDPRCPETVRWFEDTFCREGREGRGVRVDMGGEEVILFALLPPRPKDGDGARPPLTLLLGRAIRRPTRAPRPDDPMPRENLFATKLRRTNSLPVLGFGAPPAPPKLGLARAGSSLGAISEAADASTTNSAKPAARKLKRGSSSRTLMSLMGDELERKSAVSSRRSSLPPPALPTIISAVPPLPKRRALSHSNSSRDVLGPNTTSASASASFASRRPALPHATISAPAALSLPGHGQSNSRQGSLKRSRSRSAMLESPPSSPGGGEDEERQRGASRVPGSPTPSLATTFGGWDDEDEGEDTLGRLGGAGGYGGGGGALLLAAGGGGRKGSLSKRSTSAPVGEFVLGAGPLKERLEASRGVERSRSRAPSLGPAMTAAGMRLREREASVGVGVGAGPRTREPSMALGTREQSVGPAGAGAAVDSVEMRNKATIRKIILARLTARHITRDDEQFRDVFSMCSKGVQFALRETYRTQPIDRTLASDLADRHIEMYLLPLSFVAPPPTAPPPLVSETSAPAALAPVMMAVDAPSDQVRLPTPATTPAPISLDVRVKKEEEMEGEEAPTAAPSSAPPVQDAEDSAPATMELDIQGVVGKVPARDEASHLPSPRSLEAAAEEESAPTTRGVEVVSVVDEVMMRA